MKSAITSKLRARVWAKTLGACYYCGENIPEGVPLDHCKSKKHGGTDDYENLVPCCKCCNSTKRDKDIEGFRKYLVAPTSFSTKQIAILREFGLWDTLQRRIADKAEKTIRFWFETQNKATTPKA